MDKADSDDSTPPDGDGRTRMNAGPGATAEPAAPRPAMIYITATEAITLLAFGKALKLAALNAEREAFVAAEMEAQAARGTTLETGGKLHPDQLREEWAKRDGRGARMAAAAILLLNAVRSGNLEMWGTLDGDPEGLPRLVRPEFLLLPVTINNDALEPDPAAPFEDWCRARALPTGEVRPAYRRLVFRAAAVEKLRDGSGQAPRIEVEATPARPAKKPLPWPELLQWWVTVYLPQCRILPKRPSRPEQLAAARAYFPDHALNKEHMVRLRDDPNTPASWRTPGPVKAGG